MLELLCSCLAGICSYQCDFMLSWHFGFKWHRPHIVFVSHPTWSLFNHVFPIPYLGFEGMPNPAVITTGSRCSLPDEKKVKSEFQFCECISSSFPAYPRCLVYIYIYTYISVYICGYVYVYIYICVLFLFDSMSRLGLADIRRSVLLL